MASSSEPAVLTQPHQSPADEKHRHHEQQHRRRQHVPPVVKSAAGSLGGVVEACLMQPADVVKTRLQLDRAGAQYGGSVARCGAAVARGEGVPALWKGLTPFAAHLTLKYALRQGTNAQLLSLFRDPLTGDVSTAGHLASGLCAGVVEALLIVTPFEACVVKIRLQQQKGGLSPADQLKYKGPIHCARTIVGQEGLRGLWAGAVPTILRNGPNQAANFTLKSKLDAVLWDKRDGDGKAPDPWRSMVSGFFAGAVGPVCTGPFDVVKSRLMAQGGGSEVVKYKGTVHALRTIYAEEGLRALWRGLLPRLVRIPSGAALTWAVTDQQSHLSRHVPGDPALRRARRDCPPAKPGSRRNNRPHMVLLLFHLVWGVGLYFWAMFASAFLLHKALVSMDFLMRLYIYFMVALVPSLVCILVSQWLWVYYFGVEMMAMAAFFGYILAVNDRCKEILAREGRDQPAVQDRETDDHDEDKELAPANSASDDAGAQLEEQRRVL
ncbi:hypothetical protein PR202_ga25170 [Eleusine coracana subsp. coracana]|uniref:Uncharacterized protein n=1 Tax=Eleusine coracana subsp. coracana TaxID=191504 RepID=A0AAV5DAL0_ELECO|nr:hypothetical protein PR202_ga25170 [Eleusine coracana subsp. coracana]